MTPAQIRERLRALQAGDLPAHGGRTLAYVYDSGLAEADAIGLEALAMFSGSNGLDPTAFPSLLAMENDLVALAGSLLHAPAGFVGTASSGGTESVLLAVLAARDGAGVPAGGASMVLPTTAHAAFHKAAHYFGVEAICVDVDPVTFRADPAAMAAAIRDDTVLLVGSAPSYAQGVIDPIPEIAALAAERGLRCHVDACIGGWVLPHLDPQSPWDFAVPGVTSISVDLHKYAYTPKGISLLLHRDSSLRRGHLFASADWPGYTMLNSTMQSTKSGGPLAAAWAVTRAIGVDGYAELACRAREATLTIAREIGGEIGGGTRDGWLGRGGSADSATGPDSGRGAVGIPGLRVVAPPEATLLALATDESCDVFTIADEMLERGWFVQPQMGFRGMPASLHLTLSAVTADSVPEFLDALRASVAAAQAAGPIEVDAGLAAAAAALDPQTLSDADFDGLLAIAGLAGGDGELALPTRMAPVNALLDVAPPRLREALLLAFLDRLSRPTSAVPAEDAGAAASDAALGKATDRVADLVAELGADVVITDPTSMEAYRFDWARVPGAGMPCAVVRARTAAQVQAAVRWAARHGIPVVPRGAGSGLAGGANAVEGGLVISLDRMRAIEIDVATRTAVVEPGAFNAAVKGAAAAEGLWYPPDPSSFEICSIGGNIATNAGGLCCVKYGVTTDYVLGLDVVLADGRLIRLGGKRIKDVTGLSLMKLFVGSEGTLGIVTRAILRLVPAPPAASTLVAVFPTARAAAEAVVELGRTLRPSMVEFMDQRAINIVEDFTAMGLDRAAGGMLIIQSDAAGDAREREIALIEEVCLGHGASEAYRTDDAEEGEAFLVARRSFFPATERLGALLVEDVGVPVPALPELLDGISEIAARHRIDIPVVAHAGDGNTHPNLIYDAGDPGARERAEAAFADIMALALTLGGTITGEHGVGRAKLGAVRAQLGEDVHELIRAIKSTLDPQGLMNPGAGY